MLIFSMNPVDFKQQSFISLKTTQRWWMLVIFLVAVATFVWLTRYVFHHQHQGIDNYFTAHAVRLRSEQLTPVMTFFTHVGSEFTLVPAYVLLLVWMTWIRKERVKGMYIFIISVTSLLCMMGLKILFQRERPAESLIGYISGNSYPSGHTYMSFTFFGILAIVLEWTKLSATVKRSLQLLCFILPTLIAFSRVYLGVHYFTDILAGFLLAIIGFILTVYILYLFGLKIPHQQTR